MRTTTLAEQALSYIMQKRPIIVYDLETTGKNPKTVNIIQFSGDLYTCDNETGKYQKADSLNLYIKQILPLPKVIIDLTGITDEKLNSEGIYEEDAASMIKSFLDKAEIISGYNNSRYDNVLINRLYSDYFGGSFSPQMNIDVFAIAKELIDKETLPDRSYKLCNVAEYYKVAQDGFHNATVDIDNTWRVLCSEMRDLKIQLEDRKSLLQNALTDFYIIDVNHWKRSRYVDRLYILTNIGQLEYDVYKKEVVQKPERLVDPNVLVKKTEIYMTEHGKKFPS